MSDFYLRAIREKNKSNNMIFKGIEIKHLEETFFLETKIIVDYLIGEAFASSGNWKYEKKVKENE